MVVVQDFNLVDHLAHFDRERIPERVVHAKGAGALGYFEVRGEEGRPRGSAVLELGSRSFRTQELTCCCALIIR